MNIQALMKQAQQMQARMAKIEKELNETVYEATAGGGAVYVKVSGNKELKELKIKVKYALFHIASKPYSTVTDCVVGLFIFQKCQTRDYILSTVFFNFFTKVTFFYLYSLLFITYLLRLASPYGILFLCLYTKVIIIVIIFILIIGGIQMLCSDCKKNMAIIYINKIEDADENGNRKNELIGLCAPCAKKRGIKPVAPGMDNPFQHMSKEEMDGLSKQFENLFANIDMDKLSGMFGGFPGLDGMMDMDGSIPFAEENNEEENEESNAEV